VNSSYRYYRSLKDLKSPVKSIALLEKDLLAVGSCELNKLEIWNISKLSNITVLNDYKDCVNALLSVNHLNRTFLISGSADTTIRLYDSNLKCIQTVDNLNASVLALDYSPNLQLIASSSTDFTFKIWSFSYKKLIEKRAAEDVIWTICVIDNELIATGSADNLIKIWKKNNQSSLELVTTLTEHTNVVRALILLKNNSLVSGSEDNSIKVWNQINQTWFECIATLNESSGIYSFAISGKTLLMSGHIDGSIQIRNQSSFVLLQTLKQHSSEVWSIILLNNENLASGSEDTKIMIWQKINETSFNLSDTLNGHTSWVYSLVVLPNNMFASASDDKTIRIWNQTSLKIITVLNGHTDRIKSLIVIRNQNLISISYDKTIRVWDILNSFSKLTTTQTAGALHSIALFSNDMFFTGNRAGSIQMWDINSQEISFVTELEQTGNTNSTSILFYGESYLISGHSDGVIKVWEMGSFKLWYSAPAHNSSVTCLARINDFFASGSIDNQIKLWDSSLKDIQTLSYHSATIIALIYWEKMKSLFSSSSDMKLNIYRTKDIQRVSQIDAEGNRSLHDIVILNYETDLIAACSGEKTIKIWNSSLLVKNLSDHIDYVYSLEYSSKDNILISSSRDTSIKLWNTLTFTLIKTLFGHEGSVISLALIENESTLISGSCDNSIIIWNLTSFASIKTLLGHTGCVNALNIFDENKFLLSGSSDRMIFIWNIDTNFELIDRLTAHDNAVTVLNSFKNVLASGSADKTIKIWSFSYKKLIEMKSGHKALIWAVFVLENELIATASDDFTIKIWKKVNESSLDLVSTLIDHKNWINALISLKNLSLVSGSFDKTIKVWNQINETNFECVASLIKESEVLSLAICGSSLLLSGHRDGSVQIINQTSLVLLQVLKQNSYDIPSLVLLNNGKLASGSHQEIMIWQKLNETWFEFNKTLTGHTSWVFSLVVLPKHMFASASDDSSIRLWNETSLEFIDALNGHTNSVKGLISIRNEILISISYDKTIIVWDIKNSFSKLATTRAAAALYSIALFSNESFITGDRDASIQIWSTKYFTFQYEKTLTEHNDSVSDLEFMKNGFLSSASLDRTIKFWDNSFILWSSYSEAYSDAVLALKVKNNSVLISSSQNGFIRFWNTDYFNFIQTIYIH